MEFSAPLPSYFQELLRTLPDKAGCGYTFQIFCTKALYFSDFLRYTITIKERWKGVCGMSGNLVITIGRQSGSGGKLIGEKWPSAWA